MTSEQRNRLRDYAEAHKIGYGIESELCQAFLDMTPCAEPLADFDPMSNQKWDRAIREMAAEMSKFESIVQYQDALRRRIVPLLDTAENTIEFYDGHGGPMADLRKELHKWLTK